MALVKMALVTVLIERQIEFYFLDHKKRVFIFYFKNLLIYRTFFFAKQNSAHFFEKFLGLFSGKFPRKWTNHSFKQAEKRSVCVF